MFKRLKMRKLANRLIEIGSHVESSFILKLNDLPEQSFNDMESLLSFVRDYREQNVIYRLELYRVDFYSL